MWRQSVRRRGFHIGLILLALLAIAAAARAGFVPGGDDDPFGTMTIQGTLDASRGMGLDIVIGRSGQSSCLAVVGDTILSGEVHITALDYINPRTDYQPGDHFIIFTSASLNGSFDNLPWETPMYGDGISLPRGPRWVLRREWQAASRNWAAVLTVVDAPAGLTLCSAPTSAVGTMVAPVARTGGAGLPGLDPKAHYQVLPTGIVGLQVGPDGRIWVSGMPSDLPVQDIREQLRRAFAAPQPRLEDSAPLLLEPTGRIWVATRGPRDENGEYQDVLLGYDGKTFVETPGSAEGPALFVDGRAFFPGRSVISVYDGKDWTRRTFAQRCVPRLWAEPDGKGVIAVGLAGDQVWRWRGGTWTQLISPVVNGKAADGYADAASSVQGVAATRTGVWMLTLTDFVFVPFDGGETPRTMPEKPGRARGWAVGPFIVRQPLFLFPLPDGNALLGTREISDQSDVAMRTNGDTPNAGPASSAGILKSAPDGSVSLLAGPAALEAFDASFITGRLPAFTPLTIPGVSAVWTMGPHDAPRPTLVDTVTGRIRGQLRGPTGPAVAMLPDGRVVFREPFGLTAWDPATADPRLPLEPVLALTPAEADPAEAFQTNDGNFWVLRPFDAARPGVACFDGKALRVLDFSTLPERALNVTPGGHGLLIATASGWHLITPEKHLASASLEDLIAGNLAVFTAAWKGALPQVPGARVNIQLDDAGRPWVLHRDTGVLHVLIDGQWVDAAPALKAAGGPGRPGLVCPVGDGSQMLVAAIPLHPEMRFSEAAPLFGSVVKGRLHMSPAPKVTALAEVPPVPEPDGSVWMSVGGERGWSVDRVYQLNQDGIAGVIDNASPLARDGHGLLWVWSLNKALTGLESASLGLYAGESVVPHPDCGPVHSVRKLFTTRAGSTYLWTDAGLQELRFTGTAGAPAYAPGRMFFPATHGSSMLDYSAALDTVCISTPGNGILFARIP